ncbi:uncharacterized protein [Aegilops tauschii subsp. strangulata]|uniref:uncharacterized protein n=1 Tax=Aegilops tauschii subsp. strangulata TaxID=200361 RepID=UPI003CC8B234
MSSGDNGSNARQGSETPPRRRAASPARGRSRTRRTGEMVVHQQVIREMSSAGVYPTLTRTNYAEWALLMKVNLQAEGWWDAVETGDAPFRDERKAMAAILRDLPPDMVSPIGAKANAKEAWEAIASQGMGASRVREANAQRLRREFESISLRSGETIDDFSMRISTLAANLRSLGDNVQESGVVAKFLRVVPQQYAQVAIAIETLLDVSTLSLDEVTGRLRVVQDRISENAAESQSGGRLLLTEEEWDTRKRSAQGGRWIVLRRARKQPARWRAWPRWTPRRQPQRKKKREEAHLVQADEDADPAFLLMEMVGITTAEASAVTAAGLDSPTPGPVSTAMAGALATGEERASLPVFLNEQQAEITPGAVDAPRETTWFLDTGASNHMTGDRSIFAELDESVTGTVRFGDGSVVQIRGRGTNAFKVDGGVQRALTDVYFIPRLKSSVVSLGQLDELGCDIRLRGGNMTIFDSRQKLLVKVHRASNRLYKLDMTPVPPACMSLRHDGEDWKWHGRLGHLHFEAIQRMARGGLVRGLPLIEHTGELCEACLAGKQRRIPFP